MLSFTALGKPEPQGSIAFKGMRGGKPILTSDNAQLKPWRAVVAMAARQAAGDSWEPLDEPVRVSAAFYLPRPLRPRWLVPATKPDVDKLTRALLDSLADAGIVANDSRVVEFGWLLKRYASDANPAGVQVLVEWGDAVWI